MKENVSECFRQRRSDAFSASGHGEAPAQPDARDQPERSFASTDKLIARKRRPSEARA